VRDVFDELASVVEIATMELQLQGILMVIDCASNAVVRRILQRRSRMRPRAVTFALHARHTFLTALNSDALSLHIE